MSAVFWICLALTAYAYFGYPLVLGAAGLLRRKTIPRADAPRTDAWPSVTILVPVHNEASVIERKIENTRAIDYPGELEVLFISDGSTDATVELLRPHEGGGRLRVLELPTRGGKARALNTGLEAARGEIVVFSDASIMLDAAAIRNIVAPFADPAIGCASGEDYIEEGGGEGLYGRYELYLRNLESQLGSIVGASGSFYAQRRELVDQFAEGFAPDFLSVLGTVEKGYRAVSVPSAFGHMTALASTQDEFRRKVRTLVRGMTALFARRQLLNPFRYPTFSFFLLSHKLMRWWVPFFLVGMVVANAFLLEAGFYRITMLGQIAFYLAAALSYWDVRPIAGSLAGRIALYFVAVNVAIMRAWMLYAAGVRQEVWAPSKRPG